MNVVRLGEISSSVMGQAPPGKACNKEGVGTPFVKAGEFDDRFPAIREWTTQPLKHAKSGDVLICVVGATAGKINQGIECAIGRSVAAIRPDFQRLDSNYLYYFMRQKTDAMRSKSQGLAQGVITRDMIADIEIPLPPFDEQKRIAAILDQAGELRRKRQRAIDRLNQLGQAIFHEMFDHCNSSIALQEACTLVTDGTHHTPTYAEDGVIFLSAKNVTQLKIDWENIKYVPESLHIELRKRVSPRLNDVLLAKNGTTGVAALVDRDVIFDIYVSLALLRPSEAILPKFLLYAVNNHKTRRQFDGSLKGVGVSNLHLVDIRRATIPFPDLKAQTEFVRRIEALDATVARYQTAMDETQSLFASLQHRAFQGEL